MRDPDRQEIDAALAALPFASEFDEFDREEAIYWFASDWHSGQWSNLYAVLCASEFKPGRAGDRNLSDAAGIIYEELERIFSQKQSEVDNANAA